MNRPEHTPVITCKIERKCPIYSPSSNRCYLCLNEKLEIGTYQGSKLLNKKSQLI